MRSARVASPRSIPGAAFAGLTARPRQEVLLCAAFLLCILEGAARKWLLPSGSPLFYLAYLSKDAAVLALVLTCARNRPTPAARRFESFFLVGAVLLAAGIGLSLFSGFSGTGAFLTTRSILVLPGLALLASARLPGLNLPRALCFVAVLTWIPALLGSLQYTLPATHPLNAYAAEGSDAAIQSAGHVRATGTFSFISGMSWMAVVAVWVGLMLGTDGAADRRQRLLGASAIGAGLLCAFTSLSRSGLAGALGLLAAALLLRRVQRRFWGLLVLLGGLVIAIGFTGSGPVNELYSAIARRHGSSETFGERGVWVLGDLLNATEHSLTGYGYGVTQVGAMLHSTGAWGLPSHETELARVIVEVGVLGFLGVLCMRVGLLLAVVEALRRARNPGRRNALTITLLALCFFLATNTIFDHVGSAFAWLTAGIALALDGGPPPKVADPPVVS